VTVQDPGEQDSGGDVVAAALEPLLALDLEAWTGLPRLPLTALDAALGPPEHAEDAYLGWYPARRLTYELERPSGGLHVYVRDGHAVLVETIVPPPTTLLEQLGPPSAVKAHEILVDGAYVREFVYPERGLVLSVAEPFDAPDDKRIVRGRGLRPLSDAEEFGPEFYMRFEERTVWPED
jgi:hypothetical protein